MKFGYIALAGLLSVTAFGQVQQPSPPSITILGAVRAPGVIPFKAGRTITQAIAMTGGFLRTAGKKIQIERVRQAPQAGQPNVIEKIIVDVNSLLSGTTPDIPLEAGDVIRIPEETPDTAPR